MLEKYKTRLRDRENLDNKYYKTLATQSSYTSAFL